MAIKGPDGQIHELIGRMTSEKRRNLMVLSPAAETRRVEGPHWLAATGASDAGGRKAPVPAGANDEPA